MRKMSKLMSIIVLLLLSVYHTTTISAEGDSGVTYYVSTLHGNNNNDGLSQASPFYSLDKINAIVLNPGDKVLLEAGSVFVDGYLHIKGSGSQASPIVIDKYGEGNLPVIQTNGQGVWYQDFGKNLDNRNHKHEGYVSSSILLHDVSYIEINNLEITNNSLNVDAVYNYVDTMNRTGVSAVAQNTGTVHHIYLNNLKIHDVKGNVYDKHMNNGGIYFTVAQPKDEASTGVARYDDIKIENNYVASVNRWGIAVGYTSYWDHFEASEIPDDVAQTYGSSNVLIRNNYVKDVGGDAITTMYCDRPLIEYNVSDRAAVQINNTDYAHSRNGGKVAAAIWPWKSKNAIFQYNEAFDTAPNQDGQAWDADSGDGTIYQYNYSHNNGGGAVMFCYPQSIHNTFRYNISYKDLAGVINPTQMPDAHIYNNTFYVKEGVDFIRTNMAGGTMTLQNNIIYYEGSDKQEHWTKQRTRATYDNNLYFGYANTPETDSTAVKADPKFVGTTFPTQVATNRVNGLYTHDRQDFANFALQDDSPAIDAGKVIENSGNKDFFGNPIVGLPDLGAVESRIVKPTITSRDFIVNQANKTISGNIYNFTASQFISKLIYPADYTVTIKNGDTVIGNDETVYARYTVTLSKDDQAYVYTVEGSHDNRVLSSALHTEGQRMFIPYTESNGMSVAELRAGLTLSPGAYPYVYDAESNLVEDDNALVKAGYYVDVVSEMGDENIFEIVQKNSYQFALDYKNRVQGNVWFAQEKQLDGTYQNMIAYDNTYPNWQVASYYGIGVDLQTHAAVPNAQTHGLLMDAPEGEPGKKLGVAIAFRAPKTGRVTVKLRDDEPYLRQNGNTGGSMRFTLTVNGTAVPGMPECLLTQSRTKCEFPMQTLDVTKGDYIRFEAFSVNRPTKPSMHATPIIEYVQP